MDEVDCVVIGAGVVGLAVARALSLMGYETIVAEAEEQFGTGISARNSEVIHAGIYYPQGSLKARYCVAGRAALYAFCESRGVAHRRCGKLIVATGEEQVPALEALAEAGRRNGVDDLRPLTAAEARALEPELACVAAVLSPSTGLIDSHGLMSALLGEAEDHGAVLARGAAFTGGEAMAGGGLSLRFAQEDFALRARLVVNAAGLGAPDVARRIDGLAPEHAPKAYYAKGSYFSLASRSPFSRLVYPIPEPGGLGVHLTLDLGGAARFGPDVQWIEAPDYAVEPRRADHFYGEIRRYWPGLADGALVPAYAGVRPKITGPGEPAADFRIDGPQAHGVAGLINLFGIESPGLTSSLAIAGAVAGLARDALG
ncbi:NAD(P)/FAD-dependent oxidoreductase [Phenylobacterium sp.]|uniref:NAD(P)/FAD-dependent oxidoreductase n=1 Tax=Phenylobacterium sp. TaxID=1871053 RepID=UPI0035B28E28